MAGITYQLVKKYEDRFIYTIIKWKSKYYSPTSTGNKVSLIIDDISKYNDISIEYGWNEKDLLLKEQDPIDDFLRIFIARFQMGKIDRDAFEKILDGLEVGEDINNLKKAYREEKDKLHFREKCENEIKRIYERIEQKEKQKQRNEEKKAKIREERERIREEKRRLEKQLDAERKERRIRQQLKRKEEKEREKRLHELKKANEERIVASKYEIFCPYIQKPFFGKYFDSPKDIIDYIEVDVNFTMLVFDQDIEPLVKLYKDRITQDVIDVIESSEEFVDYGIPINFFKIERVSLNKESRELHYLFVLKEVPTVK